MARLGFWSVTRQKGRRARLDDLRHKMKNKSVKLENNLACQLDHLNICDVKYLGKSSLLQKGATFATISTCTFLIYNDSLRLNV